MNSQKTLLLFIILTVILFLSSCGAECKRSSDCESKTCFDVKCVDKRCVETPKEDCCGNLQCDPLENKCNCPDDCGECGDSNTYIKYVCTSTKECDAKLNSDTIKLESLSNELKTSGFVFDIVSEFNQPFVFNRHAFKMDFTLTQMPDSSDMVRIKTISLYALNSNRQRVMLAKHNVDKPFWNVDESITEEFPFSFNGGDESGSFSSLELEMSVEYSVKVGVASRIDRGTGSVKYKINKFNYVSVDISGECPASCDDGNPATKDSCSSDTNYFCMHEAIPNKCGNYICEDSENKCSCSKDCGNCEEAEIQSESSDVSSKGFKFNVISNFNQPFDINSDVMMTEIMADTLNDDAENVKIIKLTLKGTNQQKQVITLAEHNVNKVLWQSGDSFREYFPLSFPTDKDEEKLNVLTLMIDFEYPIIISGNPSTQQASISMKYKDPSFSYRVLSKSNECPELCDDGNAATKDVCSASTNFFCKSIPIDNACGNFICESNENKCTCEKDCGPCAKLVGDFMEFICYQEKCQSRIKSDISIEPITIIDERDLGFGQVVAKYHYESPFTANSSEFTGDIMFRQKYETDKISYEDIRFTGFALLEKDEVLGEINLTEDLIYEGDSFGFTIPIKAKIGDSEQRKRTVTLKAWYEYTKKVVGGDDTEYKTSYSDPQGYIEFINPNIR